MNAKPATPLKRRSTPIELYHDAKLSLVSRGSPATSVRAASVRSSIRRTAVVTDAPTDAACAANAWSFWRCTWLRHSPADRHASTTKTASSNQDIQVRGPPIDPWRRVVRTVPDDRPALPGA